jgi:hypothetical protein
VIKGLGFGEEAGLLSVLRRSRFLSFNVINGIRFYLRMLKIGLSCDEYSKDLPIPIFSRILLNNFFNIVTDGRSRSPFLL